MIARVSARFVALTVAACLALTACGGDDGPDEVGLYDRAPVPGVPDRTNPVEGLPLADGSYWGALLLPSDAVPPAVTFHVTQAFFAGACYDVLGVENCPDDFGTVDEPSVEANVLLTDLLAVTVVSDDRANFAVTADELFSLAAGSPPAAEAPQGFAFEPFPFLLTVRGGTIVEARQIWLP